MAIQEKFQISFCKILKSKQYHTKALPKRFHLNGHTIGFHRGTQKLALHYMSSSVILGVKLDKHSSYLQLHTACLSQLAVGYHAWLKTAVKMTGNSKFF